MTLQPARAKSGTVRILLADRQPVVRFGVRQMLEGNPNLHVVGEAGSAEKLFHLVERTPAEVLLVDPDLSDMTGLAVLKGLAAAKSAVRIILFTAEANADFVREALQLGARGVLAKEAKPEVVIKSIECVAAGEYWVGRELVEGWIHAAHQPQERKFGLTLREVEVVRAVTGGSSNRDIARRFKISEVTVKRHLTNIFGKLKVANRLELALFALAHKLDRPS
jgi:two-component system nitrate/nitrite response regulator NarL